VFGADYLIVGVAGKETGQYMRVKGMAALVRAETSPDGQATQRQIANRIEQLVADEFVLIAQAARIEDAILMHRDGIIEARAERIAGLAQDLGIADEAKGAGARNILVVTPRRP